MIFRKVCLIIFDTDHHFTDLNFSYLFMFVTCTTMQSVLRTCPYLDQEDDVES
jgi:hypothetical protein